MDVQHWEKTIIAWLNALSKSTPIRSINQINDSHLIDVIRKIKLDFDGCPVEFLKDIFPNLTECDSFTLSSGVDYLCAATLLLIYVSFSKATELDEIREIMCTRLDNLTQTNIAEFLMRVQEYEDIFNFSLKTIKQEISNYAGRYSVPTSVIVDNTKTPVKSNVSNNSFDSPLQGFFQTPKRSQPSKQIRSSYSMCGDGDHLKVIKKLTNQLVEEELDKASLQEQLNIHIQKCNDYENKLRNKIEEINHLKTEWEIDSKKNENEIKLLKGNILQKLEDEKKLKSELSHLENFVSTLESDLSDSMSKNSKLEYQTKIALEKCIASESQLKEANELNIQLQETIDIKEKELAQLREYYVNFYNDEKSIDLSYLDGSFDKSICPPESMGVVVDKLLREKIDENNLLKETIDELQEETTNLKDQLNSLSEQLALKTSTISELQYLNNELSTKTERFEIIEKELFNTQQELITANAEIEKLVKENSHLHEKCDILNNGLKECEEDLVNCKNSRIHLYINFIKLAEDFKSVQQRLECEVKNISKLTGVDVPGCDKSPTTTITQYKQDLLSHIQAGLSPESREELKRTNYSSFFTDDKINKLTELVQLFESQSTDWSESKVSMQKTCDQLNNNIVILKTKIRELEDSQTKFLQEKTELTNHLLESEKKMMEMELTHSSEIRRLKEELEAKENKIKELEDLVSQSKKIQEDLLFEKEALKKQSEALTCDANVKFVHEGGDYKLIQNSGGDFARVDKIIGEPQELSDSLEEVPVCNKTFDIVNLDDKNVTFSIKKDDVETVNKKWKNNATWTVSPPSKVPLKVQSKETFKSREPKRINGETWVVPLAPPKPKERIKKLSASVNDMRVKTEISNPDSSSNLTKSSSLSSVIEIDYSPPSKADSRSSTITSFFSAVNASSSKEKRDTFDEVSDQGTTQEGLKLAHSSETDVHKIKSLENSSHRKFTLVERSEDPLKNIFNRDFNRVDLVRKVTFDEKTSELQKEILELSRECDRLRSALTEAEQKRKKDKETFERNQEIIRQNITAKYESQLEHLKNEMKQLYNRELAKHKNEQSSLNSELREQNKRYKEHIDELRNQLWDLREKLLAEQKLKRDLERNYNELKKKFENVVFYRDLDSNALQGTEIYPQKEHASDEIGRSSIVRQIPSATFPTIPTEDEEEIFDNRFLEDMKSGLCKTEKPEGRLMELQYRNSLCLPHLKSSYPGETQFHNPNLFKESDLKLGLLQFGQESQSLTDSDHSMTKSLLPETKGKKKEQTSYKRPGPPTPSKNGGRLSIQSGDLRLTPRNVLKEINDQNERNRGTPNPLKVLLSSKGSKSVVGGGGGGKDEDGTAFPTARG